MPRQIAMYLCKSLTHASLPEIGRSFGGKHHSTVIHSIRKIEDLRQEGRRFQHAYQQLPGVVSVRNTALSTGESANRPVDELWVTCGVENLNRSGENPPRSSTDFSTS